MRRLALGLLVLGCSASGASGVPDETSGGSGGAPPNAPGTGGSGATTLTTGGTGAMPAASTGGLPPAGGAPNVAGAGGGVVTVAGGQGAAGPTLPTYDPNVRFEWEETDPNSGPPCPAGRYVGTFAGFYNTLIPVAGDVSMTLTESQNGEFLEVSDGQMAGVANLTIPFSAEVTGRLDCQNLRFEALLINGTYDAFGSVSTFEGPLGADYDTATRAMVRGLWTVTEPNGTSGGTGDWQAAFVP